MGKELDFNFNLEAAARRELKNKKNTGSGGDGLTENEVITLIQNNTSSYVTASDVTTQVSQEMSNYATVNDLSTLSNSIDTSLSSKADKSDITADLTTDNDNKMLAASQGVELKTQVDNKSAKFQYDEMPISSSANSGKIIQYVGATTSVEPIYISGAFYRSTGHGWEIVLNPLAASDLSGTLGTAATKNFTTNVEPNNHNLVESNAVYAAISSSLASVYEPHGNITCAELTSALLIADNVGNLYNITDSGTTDANFIGGAGQTISAGTVVSIVRTGVSTYKFNLTPGMIDLSTLQKKILENSVTVDGVAKTTVEAALGALATMTTSLDSDKQPKILSASISFQNNNLTTVEGVLSALSSAIPYEHTYIDITNEQLADGVNPLSIASGLVEDVTTNYNRDRMIKVDVYVGTNSGYEDFVPVPYSVYEIKKCKDIVTVEVLSYMNKFGEVGAIYTNRRSRNGVWSGWFQTNLVANGINNNNHGGDLNNYINTGIYQITVENAESSHAPTASDFYSGGFMLQVFARVAGTDVRCIQVAYSYGYNKVTAYMRARDIISGAASWSNWVKL